MARDWDAEWEPIINEQNEAWGAYLEVMANVTEAVAGNGILAEDALNRYDQAHRRVDAANAAVDKFINDWRARRT